MSTTPHRSASRTREPPSRPTTPLRPTSRSSLRSSHRRSASQPYGGTSPNSHAHSSASTPLDGLEPGFAELSDSMADLEANLMHLQLMHESLARFSESFAAFLYGLNMNAFCVDFPEAPVHESFARERVRERAREAVERASLATSGRRGSGFNPAAEGAEATFMTTDTSFVENPPSSKAPSKFATPAPSRVTRGGGGGGGGGGGNSSMSSARGGGSSGTTGRTTRGGAGSIRGTRGGGIPRGMGRIARGGAR